MKRSCLTFGILLTTSAGWLHGNLILTDTFDYPNGPLEANSGGAWIGHAGEGNLAIAEGAISFAQPAENDIRTLYQSALGAGYGSGSLFYAFDFEATVASTTGGGQRIAGLGTGGVSESMRAQIWLRAGSATDTFLMGITTSAGASASAVFGSTDLSIDTVYRVVVEYSLETGTSQFWLDPASTGSPAVLASDAASISTRSTIGLYNRTNVNLGSYTIDNLAVGTAFADVVAVPEPAHAAVLVGLLAGWAVATRRRVATRSRPRAGAMEGR